MRQLDQLLRQRAGPLGEAAGFKIRPKGSEDALNVDSGMGIKTRVLGSDKGLLQVRRYFGQRYQHAILLAGKISDRLVLAVIDKDGLFHIF